MAKKTYKILKVIPYQLCPKCNGDGNLYRYNGPAIITTDASLLCDVCNGAKIIPMYVISEHNI